MRYTLVRSKRIKFLRKTAYNLKIEGAFVELGSWRGGSAANFIKFLQTDDRDCWLFDSFEGLPEPSKYDTHGNTHASAYKNGGMPDDDSNTYKICTGLMDSLKYPNEKIHVVKGWYEDTFPVYKDKLSKIAVLHIDCDWYESVKYSLETFYDNVVEGGIIIIDDYGFWEGAKKAVDEFFQDQHIDIDLKVIDGTGRWLLKRG